MNNIYITSGLIILLLLFTGFIINSDSSSLEKSTNSGMSAYTVLKDYEKFEIRKYPRLFVAKTKLSSGGYDSNSSQGFRKVASFIFGGNDKNQKISMTSPVLMDIKDSVEMAFIMPQNVTPENAPIPINSDVKLEYRPEQTVAVLRFGGWANSSKIAANKKELIRLLDREKIKYFGEITYMGYNPPYQILSRKNEISIKINY